MDPKSSIKRSASDGDQHSDSWAEGLIIDGGVSQKIERLNSKAKVARLEHGEVIELHAAYLARHFFKQDPELQGLIFKRILAAARLGESLGQSEIDRLSEANGPTWEEIVTKVTTVVPELANHYTLKQLDTPLAAHRYLNSYRGHIPDHRGMLFAYSSAAHYQDQTGTFTNALAAQLHYQLFHAKDVPLEMNFLSLLPKEVEVYDLSLSGGCFSSIGVIGCLRDRIRTRSLLNAIKGVIEPLDQQDSEFEVIDAGCGAFPVMGLYAALLSERARVTCLESNPVAVYLANIIIDRLKLQDRISIKQCDATSYQHKGGPAKLLISETMDSGLRAEPMVAIMRNLKPQVAHDAVVLPSKVVVRASLVKESNWSNPQHYRVIGSGEVIPLLPRFGTVEQEYIAGQDLNQINLTISTQDLEPGQYQVVVSSEVWLGDDIVIGEDQSLITRANLATLNADQILDSYQARRPIEISSSTQAVHISYPPGGSLEGAVRVS